MTQSFKNFVINPHWKFAPGKFYPMRYTFRQNWVFSAQWHHFYLYRSIKLRQFLNIHGFISKNLILRTASIIVLVKNAIANKGFFYRLEVGKQLDKRETYKSLKIKEKSRKKELKLMPYFLYFNGGLRSCINKFVFKY